MIKKTVNAKAIPGLVNCVETDKIRVPVFRDPNISHVTGCLQFSRTIFRVYGFSFVRLIVNPFCGLKTVLKVGSFLFYFQKHISFLHGEFSRQISFPRKALDCDFSLYAGGTKGRVRNTFFHLIYFLSGTSFAILFFPSFI